MATVAIELSETRRRVFNARHDEADTKTETSTKFQVDEQMLYPLARVKALDGNS